MAKSPVELDPEQIKQGKLTMADPSPRRVSSRILSQRPAKARGIYSEVQDLADRTFRGKTLEFDSVALHCMGLGVATSGFGIFYWDTPSGIACFSLASLFVGMGWLFAPLGNEKLKLDLEQQQELEASEGSSDG